MKIALVGRYGEGEIIAGPERVARELYSKHSCINNNIYFIEYFFSAYKNSSILNKVFGSVTLDNKHLKRLGFFPFVLFLFREKFDIIHVVNSQRFILFLKIIKPLINCKIVVTFHGLAINEIPEEKKLRNRYYLDVWVERFLVIKAELLIFPSELLRESFANKYKLSQKKIAIIPNGVSKIFFNQNSTFPPIEDSINIIFYNGFNNSINRGIDQLFELLINVRHKINLFIIGNKTEHSPPGNINLTYTNPMSHMELIKFVHDKHLIVKSGIIDTFPILVAECMTLGIVPVINENTGIKVFIEQGTNGFIYTSSSSNELSDLINKIFEGKFDLERISANAKKIYQQLDWEIISQKYYKAYRSIV